MPSIKENELQQNKRLKNNNKNKQNEPHASGPRPYTTPNKIGKTPNGLQ